MGWEMVKLGDVCEIVMGQAPKGADTSEEPVGIPLIAGAGDFTDTGIKCTKYASKTPRLCKPGDVILSIRATIGTYRIADDEYCIGRGVAAIRPKSESITHEFLPFLLKHMKPQLMRQARGATFLQVSKADIADCPAPLPPLEEQQRIAKILGTVEEAITDVTTVLESTSALRQSVFRKFVRPDHPTQELGEIVSIQSGGTPSKKKPEYWGGDIPWYSPKDFKARYLSDSIDHITELAVSNANAKILPARTPAVVVRGMILAHSFPVAVLETPGAINQDVKALHLNEDSIYSVDFLAEALRANAKYALTKVLTSSHGTKRLETEELAKLPVPVMSKDNITEFDRVFSCLTQLSNYRQEKVNRLHELYASLSSRAFSGEL